MPQKRGEENFDHSNSIFHFWTKVDNIYSHTLGVILAKLKIIKLEACY